MSTHLGADADCAHNLRADRERAEEVIASAPFLDFSEPVALLAVAILPFVSDADDPAEILGRYRRVLPSGSVLALTQTSQDYPDHADLVRERQEIVQLYANASNAAHDRSRADIRALVETAGFRINSTGLVELGR